MLFILYYVVAITILVLHFTGVLARFNLEWLVLVLAVTVFPAVRVPFHLTYVLYLSTFSEAAARLYFQSALQACRSFGVEPSLLLH
ncbi:MAG: hypothetical protein N2690_03020, partial [Rhodocyclaceae bacterium]|nr:hypothetical protein [Rhodocyclaceae bacterium]